jgi:hypothetical protein
MGNQLILIPPLFYSGLLTMHVPLKETRRGHKVKIE